jgi:hypothetical protein
LGAAYFLPSVKLTSYISLSIYRIHVPAYSQIQDARIKENLVADSLFTCRIVLQPDRRQRPDRRAAWRGGRRTSDVGVIADAITISPGDPDWSSDEDEERQVSAPKAHVH